jgi:hypothetical protein
MLRTRQGQRMSKARRLVRGILAHMWYKRIIPNHRKRNFSKNLSKSPPLLSRRIRRTRRRRIVSPMTKLGTMLENVMMLSGSLRERNQQTPLRLRQEHSGMIIYCLLIFQFVIHLISGLIPVQIFMCVLMFPCFLFIRFSGLPPC